MMRQPETLSRAPTACWQAVRWQKMMGWAGLCGKSIAVLICFSLCSTRLCVTLFRVTWFQAAVCALVINLIELSN